MVTKLKYRQKLERLILEKYDSLRAFCQILKVNDSCVHRWVRGKRAISAVYITKICKLLDNKIKPDELRPDTFN